MSSIKKIKDTRKLGDKITFENTNPSASKNESHVYVFVINGAINFTTSEASVKPIIIINERSKEILPNFLNINFSLSFIVKL